LRTLFIKVIPEGLRRKPNALVSKEEALSEGAFKEPPRRKSAVLRAGLFVWGSPEDLRDGLS
jgi:hypothetical protein